MQLITRLGAGLVASTGNKPLKTDLFISSNGNE